MEAFGRAESAGLLPYHKRYLNGCDYLITKKAALEIPKLSYIWLTRYSDTVVA